MKNGLVTTLLTLILIIVGCDAALPQARDYYVFGFWDPTGHHKYITGIAGYVDMQNKFGRGAGKQYIVFAEGPSYCGNHTAYIYEVETLGNPTLHPEEEGDRKGPIAPRNFTFVSSYYLGNYCSGHDNAFHIDETGIYYGTSDNAHAYNPKKPWIGSGPGWKTYKSCAIYHWGFDWTPIGCEVPVSPPIGTQTLTRNTDTGDWWAGTAQRKIYRWKKGGNKWEYQFTYPTLLGSHHDGMTYANGSLFISDMTSDHIIQYRLNENGDPIDPGDTPYNKFDYTAAPVVEGMGFGPNQHIWVSGWNSRNLYELGGGKLQDFLNKAPEVLLIVDADEGHVPFTVEFDASASNDTDGYIEFFAWDFDGDGVVDLIGSNKLTEEALNVGAIPFSGNGFTCSSGQQYDINGVGYCKYASLEDSIRNWFENVSNFKAQGIMTAEQLLREKFDPYIPGNNTENKIKVLRALVKYFRKNCIAKPWYVPPNGCAQNCEVKEGEEISFVLGECILPEDIKEKLEQANSPIADKSGLIYTLGKEKGVDPAVALAFFYLASNFGKGFDVVTYTYLAPGDYNATVTVIDNNGLSDSDSVLLTALAALPPKADFIAIPREGITPLVVDFYDKSVDDSGIVSWLWDFGDGNTNTEQNPTHTYSNEGPFTVTLTVTDDQGLSDTIAKEIYPYSIATVSDIYAEDIYVGESAKVSASCNKNLSGKLSVFSKQTGQAIVPPIDYICNSGTVMIGPLNEAGIYYVEFRLNTPKCTQCSRTKYFQVKEKPPELETPEIHPIIVLLVGILVIQVVKKKN